MPTVLRGCSHKMSAKKEVCRPPLPPYQQKSETGLPPHPPLVRKNQKMANPPSPKKTENFEKIHKQLKKFQ